MPDAPDVAGDDPTEVRSARPNWARVVAIAALVVTGVLGAVMLGTRENGVSEDIAAPPFTLPSINDGRETVSLNMRDGRPAVVNFFASWCAPCRRELPYFASASRRLEGEVTFIGIAHQDDPGLAAEMLQDFDVSYPAGDDPEGEVARRYLLRGMPSTAFVAADGTLVGVAVGEMDAAELDGWIERTVAA